MKKILLCLFVFYLVMIAKTSSLHTQTIHRPFVLTDNYIYYYYVGLKMPAYNRVSYRTNDKGNRGPSYYGQKIKIAYFDGSTGVMDVVPEKSTFTRILMNEFKDVHIENFSRSHNKSCQERIKQVNRIDDFEYDLAVVVGGCQLRLSPTTTRWQFMARDLKNLFRESSIYRWFFVGTKNNEQHFNSNDTANRFIRNSGKIEFVDEIARTKGRFLAVSKKKHKELFSLLSKKAKKIIFVHRFIAYDKDAHPGVSKRWTDLEPSTHQPGKYQSDKSIADWYARLDSAIAEAAASLNIETLNPRDFFTPYIRKSDQYFIDKIHFTPKGARLNARYWKENILRPFLAGKQ